VTKNNWSAAQILYGDVIFFLWINALGKSREAILRFSTRLLLVETVELAIRQTC
jgi:hypothetical protein